MQVAILVHDFDRASDKGTLSITLRGRAEEQSGTVGERLRAAHLARNLEYANFISGDDIAVIAVELTAASMCTLDDKVQTWESRKQRSLPGPLARVGCSDASTAPS